MKYIIMCGGEYQEWREPRHLIKIRGEPIVARTIRMLREHGVEDIAISSNDPRFEGFGVPVLRHENGYVAEAPHVTNGKWCDAFFPTEEPACYIFGDVVFSPSAIRTIVETETEDIQFFASAPPFAPEYSKPWAEPFALKVMDQERLRDGIEEVKRLDREGVYIRPPIMWELWAALTGEFPNVIDFDSYVKINDYTCDVDVPEDAKAFEKIV